MTTKVIFNADKKIKEKAMKIAKAQGITISDYLNMALAEFAHGQKKVGIQEVPNAKTIKNMEKSILNLKKGKYDSPAFTNSKDAIKWLNTL